ncbi:MAG TPA: MauE/DoxX family redox-associated membrane protein [bacterium]|nr:MauE/DoxX family redox-associated membrane protein [bacterium]
MSRPKKTRWDKAALGFTLARLASGFILVLASLDKLGGAEKFSKMVENYHALPADLVPLAAVVIPWLEFFTGLCLCLGWRARGAALVYCALMAVYATAIAANLLQGVDMNCGCFSMDSTEKISGWTLARDLGFLALGLAALFARRTYASLDAWRDEGRLRVGDTWF